jgi:hypothetical protein
LPLTIIGGVGLRDWHIAIMELKVKDREDDLADHMLLPVPSILRRWY